MTRIPFVVLVAAGSLLAAALAWLIRPGRPDVVVGVTLGTAVAGGFAALAVGVLLRIRARGGEAAGSQMVNAFVGLMLARMIGYLAFLGGMVAVGASSPLSVCVGLVAGTIVFQAIEIQYLRKSI